jgi:hypothetical protein
MSSPTKQIKTIRKNKQTKKGRSRKRRLRSQGTTPTFSIHPEEAKPKKSK